MNRDDSTGDMERIHRGLEEFLQQEIQEMQKKQEARNVQEMQGMQKRKEPQFFDLNDVSDDSEEYLEEDDLEGDIEETEDVEELEDMEEDDMRNDYQEDWDSKEHIAMVKARKKNQKQEVRQGYEQKRKREAQSPKQNHKKRKKKKSKLRRFLITILLFLALMAGGMYYLVGKVYDKVEYQEITTLADAPLSEDGVVNILLIGNDSRTNGEDGRSDAMILLSVSKSTKKIYMTSLLRDMYVEIPGYKGNRLNAAYSYGGAELLMETIEQNFDITVNRYALVNFEAFANLVDAVGGIELELSSEEVEYVNAYLWEYNVLLERPEGTDYMDTSVSGVVHLNGAQALSYTRNRYMGTDFGRTERQRKVLEAVIRKAPKALITNPNELINGIVTNLTTNLTQEECMQLCFWVAGAAGYELEQGSIPIEGSYSNATIREMSVLEVDFEANKEFIRKNIYGEDN